LRQKLTALNLTVFWRKIGKKKKRRGNFTLCNGHFVNSTELTRIIHGKSMDNDDKRLKIKYFQSFVSGLTLTIAKFCNSLALRAENSL